MNSLTLGSVTYNKTQLLKILNNSTTGDASVILARAEIATLLSLANGSNPTAASYMKALNSAGTINVPLLSPLNYAQPIDLIPGVTRLITKDVDFFRHLDGARTNRRSTGNSSTSCR